MGLLPTRNSRVFLSARHMRGGYGNSGGPVARPVGDEMSDATELNRLVNAVVALLDSRIRNFAFPELVVVGALPLRNLEILMREILDKEVKLNEP